MEGLVSFGNKRDYEQFKKQMSIATRPLFDLIREYCLSLGTNVVEDVRMHRVVFGKSMTFRWFADIEPQDGSVAIKIQKSRKEQPQIINVKLEESLENLKESLKNAYETIH